MVVVVLVALAARVALSAWTGGGSPVEDERGYLLIAESLANGDGFALPVPAELIAAAGLDAPDVPARTAFRGPLLPLLAAPLVALGAGVSALRWLNVLLGAFAAGALTVAAGRALAGVRGASRIALVAGLVYALWPPFAYLSVRALSEPLSQLLLLGALATLCGQANRRAFLIAALLAGLAVLARPSALLPALAMGGLAAWGTAATRTGSGLPARARAAALWCAALVLVLAPWLVRNAALHGAPLLTSNSGVTLVGGGSAAAAAAPVPGKWLQPGVVYAGEDDPPDLGMYGWHRLGEAGSNALFVRDSLRWTVANPAAAARLVGWRVVRLFDPDPRSAKGDAGAKRLVGWLTTAPLLLLAAFGALRRRRLLPAPWWGLVGGTVLTAAVFYGDTRMRTCADPVLIVLATIGAFELAGLLRGSRETSRTFVPGS